ncbi:bis(5'-nucleosyl)-tetraphosphatase (symmetrical) YqeK [Bacillus spongiae]|uniref:bis(5'-nucleosyl)-tetraphosphatase (symmetrical) n=1 Tax=Bacillus spongiae TaxID=2683610 RepID=A0ABU8H938_9BACI
MDRTEALRIVKAQLTPKRYQHTLGVLETAVSLSKTFGVKEKEAELAAIFHDYAKFRPKKEMKAILIKEKEDPRLLDYNEELWHAPVGAYLVKEEAGITEDTILKAIRYHTSGRPNMTLLEKIIYVADYIEPGRDFPGVGEARKLAEKDIDQALLFALKNTMTYLLLKGAPIFPETFEAYNYLVNKGVKV